MRPQLAMFEELVRRSHLVDWLETAPTRRKTVWTESLIWGLSNHRLVDGMRQKVESWWDGEERVRVTVAL